MSRKRRKAKPAAAALSEQSNRRSSPAVAPQVDRRLSILLFVFFFASWIIMVLIPVRPLKIVGATFLALCLAIWLHIIWTTGEIRSNLGTVRRQTHPRWFMFQFVFVAACFTVFAGFWFYVAIRAAFYPPTTPPVNKTSAVMRKRDPGELIVAGQSVSETQNPIADVGRNRQALLNCQPVM